jgi:hypothetical protein
VNVRADREYASLPFTFAIAASTLNSSGEERFANNSGWGDIELCAPSGTEILAGNEGGRFDGVLAPAVPHYGTYAYRRVLESNTTADLAIVAATSTTQDIPVAKTDGFLVNSYAMLMATDGHWASREVFRAYEDKLVLQGGALVQFPASSRVLSASCRVGSLAAQIQNSSDFLELDSLPLVALDPGQKIRVGKPGTSSARDYTVKASSGREIIVVEKLSDHAANDDVFLDESHWNLDSGTSTSTPLCAGTAALMLEANQRLSWVEVRQLLRETAVKIDTSCADSIGQWLGPDGQPNKNQPFFSRRYGFGRLDAREAVRRAIEYDFPRDLMIRQLVGDDGGSRQEPLGDSPDIWVRTQDPRSIAKEQRNDPRWHEAVVRSRFSWIFARVRNRGHVASLEAWVRFYVAASQEEPYRFPRDFDLKRAEVLDQGSWCRGTRFLGEVKIAGVPPGESQVVAVRWHPGLIPPAIDSEGLPWNPYILVAISPLDGPNDGVTMLDCNNLAQRTIQIRDS